VETDDSAAPKGGILVYIDGSDTCIAAAQYAIFLAKTLSMPLTAIYVIDTKVLSDLVTARIFVKEEAFDYEYDLQQDGKRYLNYVEQLAKAKRLACKTEILSGEANVEIVKRAKELEAELLVLNELERHFSRRESHLDAKERMMRRVECTVVIVKDEEAAARFYESLEG
jgi:nucleotide-binding universal stress UspA family protein